MRDVYIIGVGNTACGRFPDKAAHVLAREAAWAAIQDSGIHARKIEIAFLRSCLPRHGGRTESS